MKRAAVACLGLLAVSVCNGCEDEEYLRQKAEDDKIGIELAKRRKTIERCRAQCQAHADKNQASCVALTKAECDHAAHTIYWDCFDPCRRRFSDMPAAAPSGS